MAVAAFFFPAPFPTHNAKKFRFQVRMPGKTNPDVAVHI
jgi:hypothetical protein